MIFIVWILCCFIVAAFAESNQRSGLLWGFLAALFSPMLAGGALIGLILINKQTHA